ncbi:glycosyltransferase [Halomonas elongata]|uniref:tetratricopeptide repeat protein n=1 Tax=Halomonas elongata TaxID=2746 RepID=UPI00335FC994
MDDDIVRKQLDNGMIEIGKPKRVLKQAQRAMASGDLDRVEMLVQHAIQSGAPHPGERRLWVRVALRQGYIDIALKRSQQALKAQPNDPQLRALDVRIKAAAGRPRQALKHVNQAIRLWPKNIRLKLVKLQLLLDLGHLNSALQLLRRMRRRWPKNASVLMAVARFYHTHGRLRATRTVLDQMLKYHPHHRQARIMRQNLINLVDTNSHAISAPLPSLLAQAQRNPKVSSSDAAEILQTIKLTTAPELIATCQEALEFLHGIVNRLTEQDKLSLFNQAERFGQAEIAHKALTSILAHGPRTPPVARTLFQKAMATIEPYQVETVISHLLRHIPQAKQATLAAEFTLQTAGPHYALERLRHNRRQHRSLPEVYNLIRFLRAGNDYALGLRYLRFCRRRWPDDAELCLQHARLLIDTGYPTAALAVLDGPPMPISKRAPSTNIRARCLLEIGQVHAAKTELDKAGINVNINMRLRIFITLGYEHEALQLINEAKKRGLKNQLTSDHFSTTVFGNLMNDLALYHREKDNFRHGNNDYYLASRYVNAANTVIRKHVEKSASSTQNNDNRQFIPHHVVQYWNERTPPQSVRDIMHSWSSLPDVDYQRFSTQSARSFLRRTFGTDYERAFRQANNIAEGADFFRLCYLRHYGGVYVDADDRLYGQLNELLPTGVGMVCFREPFDILANNFIASVPEHPAIVLASEMAAEALLSRDNDNTWSKTGPGLLTRAVASYLAHTRPTSPIKKVAILPSYMLRRQVQMHIQLPHKKTKKHWNTTITTGVDITPFFTTS